VNRGPEFRPDLYRGTAQYYDRYRLPYPAALIDDLCGRAGWNRQGKLLDLACGPGTVTFALADRFADVWAVDQEAESVEFAARKATANGVGNVRWSSGRAEDVDPELTFDAVTIGTAFHRLDRPRVARLAAHWLRAGGHLALLWCATPNLGSKPWQQALAAIFTDWSERLDASDRLPPDLAEHLAVPDADVLRSSGFASVERREFLHEHDWTVADLIGLVYSTSLLPRSVVGDRAPEFEADVRERLVAAEPSGVFREQASFAFDLATRLPAAT
jgi:SAM-dependent methyltransferase